MNACHSQALETDRMAPGLPAMGHGSTIGLSRRAPCSRAMSRNAPSFFPAAGISTIAHSFQRSVEHISILHMKRRAVLRLAFAPVYRGGAWKHSRARALPALSQYPPHAKAQALPPLPATNAQPSTLPSIK